MVVRPCRGGLRAARAQEIGAPRTPSAGRMKSDFPPQLRGRGRLIGPGDFQTPRKARPTRRNMNAWEDRIACRLGLGVCVFLGWPLVARAGGAEVAVELVAPPAAVVPAPPADAKEDEEEDEEKPAAGA